ncbi:MAG: fibronectin type III domain-containing protein [Gallionella sp.]|nr:fibronectin type III domain-containing protein [Gallionella sp.]
MADTIGIADPRDTDHRYRNIMRRHYLLPLQLLILIFMLGMGGASYAAVPDAPTIGTATAGDTQATVTFTAPASDGGAAITIYTATSTPDSLTGTCAGPAACDITVTGLTNGTAYTFAVTATNAEGIGAASEQSNSVTPATVPDAPTIGTATAGNTQATVTFTAPADNGGAAITTYTATSTPDSLTGTCAGPAACDITVTGLTNGTAYTFTVTATNAAGTSSPSSPSSPAVTPKALPGAPTDVTATAGNAQATITFTAPASNGGSAITGYTVTSSPAGGIDSNTGSTGLSHVITGLTNGTAYTFSVTATNAAGVGEASTASSPVTPMGVQTITFATPLPTVVVGGTGTVSATATSGLTVTFTAPTTTSVCTLSGSTITGVAAGKCTVAADQAGNGSYAAAPQKTQDITIGKGSQTITFPAQAGRVFDTAPFTLDPATATSGLAVSYAAAPASVCKINSATVTMVAAGTCTITATQSGNSNYNAASAVTQTIIISQASQTITFNTQAAKNFGAAPFSLDPATASSGLPVTYSSSTPTVCSINGSTVTIIAIGTCTIAANQAGNATYGTASQVTQNIVISKGNQTITFVAQTGKAFGAAPFKLNPLATADSKLEVAYTSKTLSVCTISGSTVTIVSAGVCTIAADQAGNSNYNAATQVTRDITISKGTQKITFGTQTAKTFSTTPFTLSTLATTDSGLAVTYTSTTPLVCSISGSTVTMLIPGTCTIAANQAGDDNYSAASQVTQNITISKGTQAITFGAQEAQIIGVAPFALNPVATASSGLEVSYSATPTTVCTISDTTVTALATGTCTISASQAGNSYYSAATAVKQGIVIGKTTAPGAPTLTGVTAGYGSATLSFDAPSSNGGSKITAYNAACTATGETTRTGTGAASSIIVQGLTIGVTYSCSVTAINSVGTSAASIELPVTPVASYTVPTTTSTPLTGLWWNEQEPGWGMSVTQHGAMIFMGWYAYDASGASTWYVMPSCPILGNACTGEIYSVSGGSSFITPWDGSAKAVTPAGTGILTFNNANAGTFNYSMDGTSGLISIARQVFATGLTAPVPDFSDLWWNPDESGWGVSLTQQYGTIFAVAYGYDANGKPIWYVASDCRVDGNYCSGSLYQVKGGTVPTTTWDGTNLVVTTVGFIEFVFDDASNGTMNYFINGVAGTKVITRQLF